MTENAQRPTATIIPFPVRRRDATVSNRDFMPPPVQPQAEKRIVTDAWYHEAAIREDNRALKS